MGLGRPRVPVMPDYLVDDEAQELLGELRVEIGFFGQCAQAGDLAFLAVGIGRGQRVFGFVAAHRLRRAKPLGEDVDERGVEIVDATAEAGQNRIEKHGIRPRIGRGRIVGHCAALA